MIYIFPIILSLKYTTTWPFKTIIFLGVFHWVCLDRHCRNLPSDTAPAGYICPKCDDCIFPPENLVSPVAGRIPFIIKVLDDHLMRNFYR